MKPFQYVIVYQPTEKEKKDGKKSEIVVDLKTILAADEKTAMLLAGRAIPENFIDKLNQLDVYVRPF